jgi:hypothetical protein
MNATDTDTYTAKGFIGRTEDGDRVWVEIEIREVNRPSETTEHETVNGYRELSITGAVAQKGYRNAHSWGQVRADAAGAMDNPAKGLTEDDIAELVTVWKRWHLNGMQAGCAHPGRGMDTAPCPETGYRYGHSWLVKALPADVETWVREFGDKLDGTEAKG